MATLTAEIPWLVGGWTFDTYIVARYKSFTAVRTIGR